MSDDCQLPRRGTSTCCDAHRAPTRWLALLLAAALGGCAGMPSPVAAPSEPGSRILLTGIVTVPERGPVHLEDCASKRRVVLGEMSVGNEYYLKRSIESQARREGGPVTAQVSGYARGTREGLRLDRPALMWLSSRRCEEPEERSYDYN